MIENILYQVLSVSALSLVFGALLGFSARKFAVKTDPRAEKIKSILPGVNCGACGFPSCGGFAEALVKEDAAGIRCPVGGAAAADGIAETLGVASQASGKKTAFIMCYGMDDNVKRNYFYDGPKSCIAASQLATGGNKSCSYSCIGLASCKNICPFDAIKIVDSIAVVESQKCTACGKCVTVCPKNLIEIVPDKSKVRILCNSRDRGRLVRRNCRSGCIGCAICQKICVPTAIKVENNIACINYDKCTSCMACVKKCPTKAIKVIST
jgi:Na+-translocating ferredoxin:NAD+ oxidoreductase RNF subunit RnfB